MKVLMIDGFLPENRYTFELARELQENVELYYYTKENAGDLSELRHVKKTMYTGGKKKAQALLEYARDLRNLKKELKGDYDIVHVQTFGRLITEAPIYIKARKISKWKLVHTVHNILPHEAKESDRKLHSSLYDACDLLMVHNERSKKQLVEEFLVPDEKIVVAAHGIYGDMIPNHKQVEDIVDFLMFGMIREYKGVDILLKAIALLPEDIRKKCRFKIAGKQFRKLDPTDYIGMANTLGISDSVQFDLRRIEDDELPELFANADVCLFPYREIYGSGALLMAYTYQKPVIVSNVPAFVEETENGKIGLLFESESPQSLADAIEKYVGLSDAERNAYIENLEVLVKEKYNWRTSARILADAYGSVL